MADNPAGQNVLSRAAELYAETTKFHRTYLTEGDKDRYNASRGDLEKTLTKANVELESRLSLMSKEFVLLKDVTGPLSPESQQNLYNSTKKLIDTAMKLNADLAEYKALGIVTGEPDSDAAKKTAQLLNGGDLFAGMDIPNEELRDLFRWKIVDQITRFDYGDRHDFNTSMQRQTIQNIVDMEHGDGKLAPIPRDIAELNRQDANVKDYTRRKFPDLALEAASARDSSFRKVAGEFRDLFRDQVINGERSRAESLVWNKLIDSPTIGLQSIPPAPPAPTPSEPGAGAEIAEYQALKLPGMEMWTLPVTPSPWAPAEQPEATAAQEERAQANEQADQQPAGQTGEQAEQLQSAALPTGQTDTPSPAQNDSTNFDTEAAPAATDDSGSQGSEQAVETHDTEEQAQTDEQGEIDYSDAVMNIRNEYQLNGELKAGDILDILGQGHKENYDPDAARETLGTFIKEKFGINLDDDIDPTAPGNTQIMKNLAVAAALYNVTGGNLADMQSAFENSKDGSTQESDLVANVRSIFGGALEALQVSEAAVRRLQSGEVPSEVPDQSDETPTAEDGSPPASGSAPTEDGIITYAAAVLGPAALGAEIIRRRVNRSKRIAAEADAAEEARKAGEVTKEPKHRKAGFDLEANQESKSEDQQRQAEAKTNVAEEAPKSAEGTVVEENGERRPVTSHEPVTHQAATSHNEHVMPERVELKEPEFHLDNTKNLKDEAEWLLKEYEAIVKERKKVAELKTNLDDAKAALPTGDEPLSSEQKKLKKKIDKLQDSYDNRHSDLQRSEKNHENNRESHNRARAKHEERERALVADYETLTQKQKDLAERYKTLEEKKSNLDTNTYEERKNILRQVQENIGTERLNLDARNTMHDGPVETLRPWEAPRHLDVKLGRGVGMGFGAWSLGHRLFGGAGQEDFKDERGTALTGIFADSTAIGADAAEIRRAGKIASAAQAQQPVAKAAARAALVAEETLEKTAQVAGKVKTGGKLLTPVAIGATVVSSGVDFELGRRKGDAGRAAGATGAATGGLAGATGLAILGAKLGATAGSFVVPGLGTIGGATIGAVVGGTIGALGGGYIGEKIARITLTSRFSSWLGIDDELKKAAEGGFSPELIKRYDRTHDNKLDLDEIKEALKQNGIEALRDMDQNKDGLTNDELKRGLDGTLGLAREQFASASILPTDPTVLPPGSVKIEPRVKK